MVKRVKFDLAGENKKLFLFIIFGNILFCFFFDFPEKIMIFFFVDGGDVLVRPGALHYMLGKITFAAEADKATAPAVVRYSGTGYMITEVFFP